MTTTPPTTAPATAPASAPAPLASVKAKPAWVTVLGRAAARKLDEAALSQYAIPGVVLMENAAREIAAHALSMLRPGTTGGTNTAASGQSGSEKTQAVLLFCGPGNNGGDGLAVARHLANAGVRVSILLSTHINRLKGESAVNCAIVQKMKLPMSVVTGEEVSGPLEGAMASCVQKPALVIDALLGTGAEGTVKGAMAQMIQEVNKLRTQGVPVLSVDIPSGLDADTGAPLPGSPAVCADLTVTMAGIKVGFMDPAARAYTGRVVIGDIGVPTELLGKLGERMVMPAHLIGPVPGGAAIAA